MRRLISAAIAATLLVAMSSAVALGAKPTIIDLNDPEFDADESVFWTQACDFPVTAQLSGHIIEHNPKGGAVTDLVVYHIDETLTSESSTYRLLDVGPDIFYTRGGVEYVAVVGRSLTGSGVIGRVEVNLETGEIVWHGRLVGDEVFGDFTAPVCRQLAPAE